MRRFDNPLWNRRRTRAAFRFFQDDTTFVLERPKAADYPLRHSCRFHLDSAPVARPSDVTSRTYSTKIAGASGRTLRIIVSRKIRARREPRFRSRLVIRCGVYLAAASPRWRSRPVAQPNTRTPMEIRFYRLTAFARSDDVANIRSFFSLVCETERR